MEGEKIIPTQYKSKIPHSLSYPVGAEAISEALRGVPQFPELSVHFSYWNQLARHHGTATPYKVIEVLFSGPLRFFSASLSIEEQIRRSPRWTIGVQAVPRSLRHVIQSKMLADALPSIRGWLLKHPHSPDRGGMHWLAFSFDELKGELVFKEQASVEWKTQKADI